MLATHRKRLQTLASHPFKKWEDGIEDLIRRIPEHDYSTLPANRRPKIAAEEERPFWTALSNHCLEDEVGADACRAIYEWMAEVRWHPAVVSTEVGDVELSKCHVTQSSTLVAAALEAQVPTVVLSASACAFCAER